jgi:PEP-CTERM motif
MRVIRRISIAAVLASLVLGLSSASRAQTSISSFLATPNLAGNQSFGLSLGSYFTLTSGISVSEMGVFDSGGDGITGTLQVAIFTQAGTQVGGTLTSFDSGSQGTLSAGSYRFKSLSTNVFLGPGNYAIVARGFSNQDQNYNSFGGPSSVSVNFTGSEITWGNSHYNSNDNSLSLPTTLDTTADRYGAGAFAVVIPEPGALALLGLGIAPLAATVRRRRK